jgi:hypothetical protein
MTAYKSTAASVLSRRALLLNGAAMAALAAFSPVTAAAQLDTDVWLKLQARSIERHALRRTQFLDC